MLSLSSLSTLCGYPSPSLSGSAAASRVIVRLATTLYTPRLSKALTSIRFSPSTRLATVKLQASVPTAVTHEPLFNLYSTEATVPSASFAVPLKSYVVCVFGTETSDTGSAIVTVGNSLAITSISKGPI